MEMEHAHPMEISIRGFDASHLLPLSTNRFFRLNQLMTTTELRISFLIFLMDNHRVWSSIWPGFFIIEKLTSLNQSKIEREKLRDYLLINKYK